MRRNRLMSMVILAAIVFTSVTGCAVKSDTPIIGKIAGLKSNQIFKVDDLICTKPEYMTVLMNTQNQYKSDFGGTVDWKVKVDDKTTLESYVVEKVKQDISLKYTLAAMASNKGITLTDKEKNNVKNAAEEYFKSLSDEEKNYIDASASDIEKIYTNYFMADKLYSNLTNGIGTKVSDEEARVIKIQYIRMSSDNTRESKIKSTLENVIDLVNGGYQQFSREAKQYSEDNTVEKVIKKNEASANYEKAAFNLNSKEMTSIISDGNNSYLVYCVDSYMKEETTKNKQDIITKTKEEYFNKQYNYFLDDVETDFNTDEFKKITLSQDDKVKNTGLIDKYDSMSKAK